MYINGGDDFKFECCVFQRIVCEGVCVRTRTPRESMLVGVLSFCVSVIYVCLPPMCVNVKASTCLSRPDSAGRNSTRASRCEISTSKNLNDYS